MITDSDRINQEDLDEAIEAAIAHRRPKSYINALKTRRNKLVRLDDDTPHLRPQMTKEVRKARAEQARLRSRERQLVVEEQKKIRQEAADKKLREFIEDGKAYRFLQGVVSFMETDGLKYLKKRAIGTVCRACQGSNGEAWAWKLMVDGMKMIANLEEARLIARTRERETSEPRVITAEFPSEGVKA